MVSWSTKTTVDLCLSGTKHSSICQGHAYHWRDWLVDVRCEAKVGRYVHYVYPPQHTAYDSTRRYLRWFHHHIQISRRGDVVFYNLRDNEAICECIKKASEAMGRCRCLFKCDHVELHSKYIFFQQLASHQCITFGAVRAGLSLNTGLTGSALFYIAQYAQSLALPYETSTKTALPTPMPEKVLRHSSHTPSHRSTHTQICQQTCMWVMQ